MVEGGEPGAIWQILVLKLLSSQFMAQSEIQRDM
jgi:hypothetical protein